MCIRDSSGIRCRNIWSTIRCGDANIFFGRFVPRCYTTAAASFATSSPVSVLFSTLCRVCACGLHCNGLGGEKCYPPQRPSSPHHCKVVICRCHCRKSFGGTAPQPARFMAKRIPAVQAIWRAAGEDAGHIITRIPSKYGNRLHWQ